MRAGEALRVRAWLELLGGRPVSALLVLPPLLSAGSRWLNSTCWSGPTWCDLLLWSKGGPFGEQPEISLPSSSSQGVVHLHAAECSPVIDRISLLVCQKPPNFSCYEICQETKNKFARWDFKLTIAPPESVLKPFGICVQFGFYASTGILTLQFKTNAISAKWILSPKSSPSDSS